MVSQRTPNSSAAITSGPLTFPLNTRSSLCVRARTFPLAAPLDAICSARSTRRRTLRSASRGVFDAVRPRRLGWGRSKPSQTTLRRSCKISSPCFLAAEIPTTGTPSSASSRRRSIVMPAAAASSIRLTQSMTRSVRSMTSSASSIRSRFVASQTASVQQRSSRARNSVAISSSREQPCSE